MGYGRLLEGLDPLNGETGYGYDLMSNLVSLIDARQEQTSFTRTTPSAWSPRLLPGPTQPLPFEEYTYDAAGRLATRK